MHIKHTPINMNMVGTKNNSVAQKKAFHIKTLNHAIRIYKLNGKKLI
jgi:hypothetical protein